MVSYAMYPRYALIENITQALNAVVTFAADHDYTDGEILSFRVSIPYGMRQINNQQARVLSHTDDTVTIDLDTTQYFTFVLASNQQMPAMTVPAASGIIPGQYVATINLEDAFDNRRV